MPDNEDLQTRLLYTKADLLSSLLLFTQVFFKLRTGRDFIISQPISRESHYITVSRKLTQVFNNPSSKTYIHIPPRYGKTELLIHFVAWVMARYPDSNFIYISYSHSLAAKQTQIIREIMTLPYYGEIFDVELSDTSSAKDNFETKAGGSIYAVGAGGTITGRGAGVKGITDRFTGALLFDDIHKPDEVLSDVIREGVINWFYNTAQSRLNNGFEQTPIIGIGQRLHEEDLPAYLYKKGGWDSLVIPAIDLAGNVLDPAMDSKERLLKMKEETPYEFAAQYQQDPQPAGGGLFKPEWFKLFEFDPEIITSFITADTAETDKSYNDPTVFSFWGIYKIRHGNETTDYYALHWIDCRQIWVEPKDLFNEFMSFWASCMRHKVKPELVAIEKKTTGVTLLSVLNELQGLKILNIDRTKASGSKTARFIEMQPFVGQKLVSLPTYGQHTAMCIEHMRKITANNSHRYDDIADTLYDAIRLALIDKTVLYMNVKEEMRKDRMVREMVAYNNKINDLKREAYYGK